MEETIVIDKSDFEHIARSFVLLERRFREYREYIKEHDKSFSPISFFAKGIPKEYLTKSGSIKWKKLRTDFN